MHVATTTRRHGEKVYTTTLLRQSYRENGKVRHRTLANLSHLPDETIELIKASLAGCSFVPADQAVRTIRSLPHGDIAAVWGLAEKLGFPDLLGSSSPLANLALGLICSQVVEPASKAAYPTWWEDRTLGVDLGIAGVHSDACYEAMDWLLAQKDRIERALVKAHITEGSFLCYDLSSSYVEGSHNELAGFGHSRDGKAKKRQIEYGVVATREGLPVAIEVFPGNTADPKSFMEILRATKERFGLKRVVFVGDRGMITSARRRCTEERGWFRLGECPSCHADQTPRGRWGDPAQLVR